VNVHTIHKTPQEAKWDLRFLEQAKTIASWSKDRSTKVGCVIVGPNREIRTTGYNGFPRGVTDDVDARHERPEKYRWFEHGERNAIFNAARMGTSVDGCTAYVGSIPAEATARMHGPPCVDCARALIQSGITRVVCEGSASPNDWRADWRDSMLVALRMFIESGVIWEAIRFDS
jgi:dCMP deaminase